MTIRAVIGDTPRRREDARFTTGQGGYLDDLRFDGVVHAVVLRSPHAHARIERIDAGGRSRDARRARGADRRGCARRRSAADAADAGSQCADRRALRLRAAAVAGDRQGAPCRRAGGAGCRRDARAGARCAERIVVDYDPLPAVTTRGCARGGMVRRRSPTKCRAMSAWTGSWGDAAAVDAAFAAAAHVVSLRLDNHRIVTNPMEPRGAVGML